MVRRRELTLGLLLAAGMWGARAQPKARIYRIAVVSPSQPVSDLGEAGSREFRAFFQRLRQLGYIEGQNLSVERYSANGRTERFTELADEVVRRNPDLIYVSMYRLVRDFKAATDAIPIVGSGGDPIAFGVTTSLARPGGNITGVTVDAGVEIWGKRLDLLREMLPGASRVAWLASAAIWKSPYAATLREGAQRLNMTVIGPPLVAPFDEAEYRRVFAAMAQSGADALFVASQAENVTNRRLIVDLAERARLPTIYPYKDFTDVGGLMAYGADLDESWRHAADQVDQIFKGMKPGEIPFYQPTRFSLVINLKTAMALGLEIPGSILARANEVIE